MKPLLLTLFAGCLLFAGCAKDGRRFAPTNPDLPAVVDPVRVARASAVKASTSAARAVQIAERIVPTAGQEATLKALRLELATTVEELRLTGTQLDEALLKSVRLEKQIADMRDWGIAQQARADTESDRATAERERANKEYTLRQKVTQQRDIFVYVIAALGTVALLLGAQPLLARFSLAFGANAPLAAILIWGAAAAAAFLGIFAGVQLTLDLIV